MSLALFQWNHSSRLWPRSVFILVCCIYSRNNISIKEKGNRNHNRRVVTYVYSEPERSCKDFSQIPMNQEGMRQRFSASNATHSV